MAIIRKYGIDFPAEMPSALIELKCWKHWREPEYAAGNIVDPWECFWRAVYTLVPREDFVRHRWSEEHVYDWTTEKFVITWGCASSGKSNDYGLLSVLDWMTDPADTVTILASTTLSMLKIRSYESVIRYFKKIQRYAPYKMPGKIRKTDSSIILDDADDSVDATDKASIRGVPVAEGTEEEARSKLQGAHLPYVRLVLDELSQMRSAAMAVRTNLAVGAVDFKLIGLCNIDSFNDLAGRHSVPVKEGGFAALDPDLDEVWRSQYGKVRRHDGLRSPAILEPHRRELKFLLTRQVLDELVQQAGGNMDDRQIWTMIRAWPPAQGKKQTLLSMAEVVQNRAMEGITWRNGPSIKLVGIDPAFSEDGNQPVMQPLEIGYDVDGLLRFYFPPPRFAKIDASSKTPVLQQLGEQVVEFLANYLNPNPAMAIDPKVRSAALASLGQYVGVDDSATQSLADYLKIAYDIPVRRFSANTKASEMRLATTDVQPACERVYNQGTELWAATAAFVRAGQIRGLPGKAVDQLTTRPVDPDKRPLRLVSKKAKVDDGGTGKNSPDDMDAVGFAVGVARFYLNLTAGSATIPLRFVDEAQFRPEHARHDSAALARKYDLDATAYQHGMITP